MNNILYKIDLDIDVKNESIKSDLNLKYYSNTDNREEIILYLYYNLLYNSLFIDNLTTGTG